MISLTRLYRFCGSHRLHCNALSDRENARIYGKCNNPYGHGHDYVLEVTASGPVDPVSGLLLPVAHLDRLVDDVVLRRFAHRNMNADLPEFAELVPTTENIALVITRLLQEHWDEYIYPPTARLARVFMRETDRNSFEVLLPVTSALAPSVRSREASQLEGFVTVHA
jgi:6-pyruvoyltetrahydropterin/6-carboxytetrahydropterin synthase